MINLIIFLCFISCFSYCQQKLSGGELIEGFENINEWIVNGDKAFYSSEEVQVTEGKLSIKLGSTAEEKPGITKTINLNFDKYGIFSIDLYVSETFDQLANNLRVELSSTGNFKSFFQATFYGGERFFRGWNRIVFSKNDFINDDNESWSNQMIRLRISIWLRDKGLMKPGFLIIDNFRAYEEKTKAVSIITFDDNWKSNLDIGKPILDSLGFKAVEYVIGNTASQSHPDRLNWEHLDSLYKDGWDISNHTYSHPYLSEIDTDSLEYEINGMRDTLFNRGYTRSCDFFAYPYGNFNYEVVNKVKEKHKLVRSTKDWQYNIHPSGLGYDYYLIRKQSETDTYEQTCLNIDKAIERGQLFVFLFHDIATIAEKFRLIMRYLKEKQDAGLIKVMTMSEYYNYLNSLTAVSENYQKKFNYILFQNYPNPFNSSTKINYEMGAPGTVILEIFNVLGQKVYTLFNNYQNEGKHEVIFDASNLSSGIYIYRLIINNHSLARKMTLLK